ncbi:MAG: pyridoxal phosphate-dependent aminotransferase [Anaerolineales bacterium]|nr:pyridoxal phosphate-dependent aminotransferase [Chloroflexota bacterium]MBL6982658.1 pyridoxal phosphate-dependent aminotransferase [Anaerolineales bacterium]
MSISIQARAIAPSPTFALNEKARLLREKGEPVISLGIGEPKNPTPINAILSSSAKLRVGDVKYSRVDGTPSLKKAIIRYTEEHYGRVVAPENIIVTTGAKQSLYNIIYTLVNPQDEVIMLAPYWVSYPEMIKMCYGVPVEVVPEDGTFYHRMQDIEQKVSSYTKAIIINSPNNPSGVMYSEAFVAELVEFCERKGIYLIMDDIYHKLVFDRKQWIPGYKHSNKDVENSRLIVVNGIAKSYGMTGFRIGWVVAPRKLVEVMTNVQGNMTSNPSVLLQSAAEGALTGQQATIENLRLTIENNRSIILNELKAFNDIKLCEPDGTFYCLPDFRAYDSDSSRLAKFILDKALVVTVPGAAFGMEGHLRLSYAGSVKHITEGIERIRWVLDPEAPNEIYIGDRKLIRDWL